MSNKQTVGVSIPTVLLVVFIVLKLTDNIDWSWMWVLSPLWGPLALGLVLWLIFTIVLMPVALVQTARKNKFKD